MTSCAAGASGGSWSSVSNAAQRAENPERTCRKEHQNVLAFLRRVHMCRKPVEMVRPV